MVIKKSMLSTGIAAMTSQIFGTGSHLDTFTAMHFFNPRSSRTIYRLVAASEKWWAKFVVKPLFASILPIVMAFYSAQPIHSAIALHYPDLALFLDTHILYITILVPIVIFATIICFGFLEKEAKDSGSIDDIMLYKLLTVLNNVVGAKADRFSKAYKSLKTSGASDPGDVFRTITKPDEQISLLGFAIYSFFATIDKENVSLQLGVAPLEKGVLADEWLCFAPQSTPPDIPLRMLKECPDSTVSTCLRERSLVIIENTLKEQRKKKKRRFVAITEKEQKEEGSLICFPVLQPAGNEIAYIVSIYANKKGYFLEKKQSVYERLFEHFALRIRLEDCLLKLRTLAAIEGDA